MKNTLASKLKSYIHHEDGNTTVEFTLWVPFLFVFFLAIGEIAMIFYGQSRILQVAQDATRQASIGRLQTSDDVSNFISGELSTMASSAQIQNRVDKGVITTAVTVPISELAPFGFFTTLVSTQITVVAQQVAEY